MVDTEEIWKDVTINPNYMVSNLGRVKAKAREVPCKSGIRKKKERILSQTDSHGYLHVGFLVNGKLKNPLVHRLVLAAFREDRPYPEWEVDHINGNTHDNRLENLEYVSSSENSKRAYSLGLQNKETLSRVNPKRKATPEEVAFIKKTFLEENRTLSNTKENVDFYKRMAEMFGYSQYQAIYNIIVNKTNRFFGEDIVQTTNLRKISIEDLDFSHCKSTKDKCAVIAQAFNVGKEAVETRVYTKKQTFQEILDFYNMKQRRS